MIRIEDDQMIETFSAKKMAIRVERSISEEGVGEGSRFAAYPAKCK
jgi:hypothetical protein